jgi:hypothetical protein
MPLAEVENPPTPQGTLRIFPHCRLFRWYRLSGWIPRRRRHRRPPGSSCWDALRANHHAPPGSITVSNQFFPPHPTVFDSAAGIDIHGRIGSIEWSGNCSPRGGRPLRAAADPWSSPDAITELWARSAGCGPRPKRSPGYRRRARTVASRHTRPATFPAALATGVSGSPVGSESPDPHGSVSAEQAHLGARTCSVPQDSGARRPREAAGGGTAQAPHPPARSSSGRRRNTSRQ